MCLDDITILGIYLAVIFVISHLYEKKSAT